MVSGMVFGEYEMKRFYHVDRYIQDQSDEKRFRLLHLRNIQQKCSNGGGFTKTDIKFIQEAVEMWLYRENDILEQVAYMRFQDEHRHTWTDYHAFGEDEHFYYKKCDKKDCDCQKYKETSNGDIIL